MGFVGSMLGVGPNTGAGGAGMDYRAGDVKLLNPTSIDQTSTAYNQSQDALIQQQKFMQALQAQNGIGNQSQVFNQLQGVANGTGPNPAQAALNQATGANVANQAALMAGQRGAGANVGLMARQAAQQGAGIQQQAAGQGATLQAQQELGALNTMGGVAGQQVQNQAGATGAYNQFAQNEQQNLLNSVAQYNNANVAQQSSQNSANSGLANTVAGQQGKLASGVFNGAAMALMAKGGEVKSPPVNYAFGTNDLGVSYPAPSTGPRSFAAKTLAGNTPSNHSADAPISGTKASGDPLSMNQKDPEEKAGENIGKALGKGAKAIGKSFSSTDPTQSGLDGNGIDPADYRYDIGEYGITMPEQGLETVSVSPGMGADLPPIEMLANGGDVDPSDLMSTAAKLAPMLASMMAKGGLVDALLSPGELYLPPSKVKKFANSKDKAKELKKDAKRVPGKANVKGDSLKNDKVPAKLEEGGIVIPRSISTAKDAPQKAAAFVAAHLAKHGRGLARG